MRARAGIAAVATAAALATLAPTTAGGEDGGRSRASAPPHQQPHQPSHQQQQPGAGDPHPPAARWDATAVPAPYGEPLVPVLPLGAGLTCLGVGIAIIGLRIRNG